MPGDELNHEDLVKDLHTRFSRVERAILGDPTAGHIGLVNRVEVLEQERTERDDRHFQMEERRRKGDEELHNLIEKESRRVDRLIYAFAGGVVVGLGGGASTVWAIIG